MMLSPRQMHAYTAAFFFFDNILFLYLSIISFLPLNDHSPLSSTSVDEIILYAFCQHVGKIQCLKAAHSCVFLHDWLFNIHVLTDTPYWSNSPIVIVESSPTSLVVRRPELLPQVTTPFTHFILSYRTADDDGEFTDPWDTIRIPVTADTVEVKDLPLNSIVQLKWTATSESRTSEDSFVLTYRLPQPIRKLTSYDYATGTLLLNRFLTTLTNSLLSQTGPWI